MKKIFILNLLLLALPLAAEAKTLSSATTLKILSPDGLTSVKDLTVNLFVNCKYRRQGILWPEPKSCGSESKILSVSNDGTVSIPEIKTFKGLRAMKADNYEITLSVYEGKKYLAILSSRGKEAIKNFAENKKQLNILRFNAANLGVNHDGQDFFGSDLAKDEKAYALFSIKPVSVDTGSIDSILVTSSLNGLLQGFENKNSYKGKVLLKDLKEISIPKTALAFFGESKDIDLQIGFSYSIQNGGVQTWTLKGSTTVKAKADALNEIGSLELK